MVSLGGRGTALFCPTIIVRIANSTRSSVVSASFASVYLSLFFYLFPLLFLNDNHRQFMHNPTAFRRFIIRGNGFALAVLVALVAPLFYSSQSIVSAVSVRRRSPLLNHPLVNTFLHDVSLERRQASTSGTGGLSTYTGYTGYSGYSALTSGNNDQVLGNNGFNEAMNADGINQGNLDFIGEGQQVFQNNGQGWSKSHVGGQCVDDGSCFSGKCVNNKCVDTGNGDGNNIVVPGTSNAAMDAGGWGGSGGLDGFGGLSSSSGQPSTTTTTNATTTNPTESNNTNTTVTIGSACNTTETLAANLTCIGNKVQCTTDGACPLGQHCTHGSCS